MTTAPDRSVPDIREYLDAGGDVTDLPDLDVLIEETIWADAAGIASMQRQVAQALWDELNAKGAAALPADLIGDDVDLDRRAAGLRDHHRRVLDLLADADLRHRFAEALPAATVSRTLRQAADHRRREIALQVVEALAADPGDVSTRDLEAVADLIGDVIDRTTDRG